MITTQDVLDVMGGGTVTEAVRVHSRTGLIHPGAIMDAAQRARAGGMSVLVIPCRSAKEATRAQAWAAEFCADMQVYCLRPALREGTHGKA